MTRLPLSAKGSRPTPAVARWRSRISFVLIALLAVFILRVIAQWVQRYWPIGALPDYDTWQSGLLPYWMLLTNQVLIAVGFGVVTFRLAKGHLQPRPKWGACLLSLGAIYFAAMLFRLGMVLDAGFGASPFMGKPIPPVFHLVISAWLIVLGLYHYQNGHPTDGTSPGIRPTLVHWLAYPVLIAVCLLQHFCLLQAGIGLLFSTYLPVIFGAAAIAWLERAFPHRPEWQPRHDDVASDLTFMVFVQILLPKILVFLIAVTILRFLQSHEIGLHGLWPHRFPAAAQAGLMVIGADLLRYWLHRASHEWSPLLWRFHAVHHSPPKLYWMNVGRFHPIEKALQFLCDAAPFILVGVSENVLALYFVFYAVNGFFQHCNAEVRLGLLNYIISGPELHRWHHSREVRESNKNYGNNVIIWDLLFSSYFLPKDRRVETLGLKNRAYPTGFFRQLQTPFIKGLDQDQE